MTPAEIEQILETRELYPVLAEVVRPRELRNAARDLESHDGWSLPEVMLARHPCFQALVDSLMALKSAKFSRKTLARKLLNKSQFLNTFSELALARTLLQTRASIELDFKFFENRDVDIHVQADSCRIFIEVVNLGLHAESDIPTNSVVGGSIRVGQPNATITNKIKDKFQEKFAKAVYAGWKGFAVIAIDLGKRHQHDLEMMIRKTFEPNWLVPTADELSTECPGLGAIMTYRTRPELCLASDIDVAVCSSASRRV